MKKSLIIIAIVLIIIVFVVFIFSLLKKDISGEGLQINDFFPFLGTSNGPVGEIPEENIPSGETPEEEITTEQVPLRQITSAPVSGFALFEEQTSSTTSETRVRYMEQKTGHIYSSDSFGKKERISNTTIPRVYETFFASDKTHFIFRYLSDEKAAVETFSGEIVTKPGETGAIDGKFLEENIASVSSEGNSLFYLREEKESVSGFTSGFTGLNKKQVFSSSFREWAPLWWGNDTILLTTKPSSGVAGFSYTLSLKDSSLTKVLGNLLGLTTLPDKVQKKMLYGENKNNSYVLSLYELTKKSSFATSLSTLPEKCAWLTSADILCGVPETGARGDIPDAWYKGIVSFSDQFWKINADAGTTSFVASPLALVKVPLDVISPVSGNNGSLLFFINKKDRSLWVLDLSLIK